MDKYNDEPKQKKKVHLYDTKSNQKKLLVNHNNKNYNNNYGNCKNQTELKKNLKLKTSKSSINSKCHNNGINSSQKSGEIHSDLDPDKKKVLPKNKNLSSLKKKSLELHNDRIKLPVYQYKSTILNHVLKNQVTILVGETGSGKSTQIPQILMEKNKKKICVTQPRRVAAISLAKRVSEEYGCILGEDVGYHVRFSNLTDPQKTHLKYLTDGMILREIMIDPKLSQYSTVIVDEAHERSISTDLFLGILKELIISQSRPDLKIIIMSATLDMDLFSSFFNNASILHIEGKLYPIKKYFLTDVVEDIVDSVIRCVLQINLKEPEGDILCFLPGQSEIDRCHFILKKICSELPKNLPMIVSFPLYASLSLSKQNKVFDKLNKRFRKVVLATNIAETSLTISGIKYVIDSGLRKVKIWKHQLGLSTLLTTVISQNSAIQRAGRAGRESPGKVFCLFSEKTYHDVFPKKQESEILKNEIIYPVLILKKLGIDDLLNWSWIDYPGEESILNALNNLYLLGALNHEGKLTSIGNQIAILPLHPRISVVLIESISRNCLRPVIDIISCISIDNLFINIPESESFDETIIKRQQFCPLGLNYSDLICYKEFFDYFHNLFLKNKTDEMKSWCKELSFNLKGFKNVIKIREQLENYVISAVQMNKNLIDLEKKSLLNKINLQLYHDLHNIDIDDNSETARSALDIEVILLSFLKGFHSNTAVKLSNRTFKTLFNGQAINIHPSSVLFSQNHFDYIMYLEYVYTKKSYARCCSLVKSEWLQEVASKMQSLQENDK